MTFANSFNVARRLTEKNEPDLLQDTFVRGEYEFVHVCMKHVIVATDFSSLLLYKEESFMSYEQCQRIASQLGAMYDLPSPCQKYGEFSHGLARDSTMKAFDGMGSQAAAAASARAMGRESYPQIQRRYTNPTRFAKEDH